MSDLGKDFTVVALGSGAVGSSILNACPELNDTPRGTTQDDGVVLQDQNSSSGLAVSEALFQVPPGDAASDMAVFASVPTSCASFSGDFSGLALAFTAAPLTVSPLGAETTTAMRLTGTTTVSGQQIAIYFDFVIVLHHDTIIVAIVSQTPPDINDTQTFASDAYAKVAARW